MMNNQPSDPLDKPLPTPFKFSVEDQRLLQECNREAFYQRCLPCATGFAGLTFMAVRAGYLKPHLTWGPTPKVIGAAFLGYMVGKISYQAICAEKMMANPNSEIGAALRARRRQGGGGFQDTLTLDLPGLSLPKEGSPNAYSENTAPNTFTDLNTDRPYQDLDDTYQPGFDSPQRQDDFTLPPQSQNPNSYDEMRRKNREDFEKKSRSFSAPADPVRQYPPPRPPSDDTIDPIDRYRPTNKYGDIFDK